LLGGEVDLSILRTGPKKAQFFRDEKVPPMTVPLGRSGPDLGGPLAHFIVSNSKKIVFRAGLGPRIFLGSRISGPIRFVDGLKPIGLGPGSFCLGIRGGLVQVQPTTTVGGS
jgi:hypothetical protein